jgi:hypothetical protein
MGARAPDWFYAGKVWKLLDVIEIKVGLTLPGRRTCAKGTERRLVAILATEVASIPGLWDSTTEVPLPLAALRAHRNALIDSTTVAHRGCLFTTTGDRLRVEFGSVAAPAIAIQHGIVARDDKVPEDKRI